MSATLIAVLICLVGIGAHWGKKYLRAQTDVDFVKYIFVNDLAGTLQTIVAVIGAAAAMVTQTELDPCTIQGAITLFGLGFAFDSTLNTDGSPRVKNE